MESIAKILQSLNLVYYEYDKKSDMIVFDKRYSNTHTLGELIKLTYYLTSKKITFDVLKDSSILLNRSDTLSSKIQRKVSGFFTDMKNKRESIYVLSEKKVKWAKNLPLFEIEFLKKIDISLKEYEALVFTSKNAIEAINKIDSKWKDIPSYVISEQSGKLVKDFGGRLKFFSKQRHGEEFAEELIPLLKNKRVLYIAGEVVAADIAQLLKEADINCDKVVVYKNRFLETSKKIQLPDNAKIIFSSPSTIEYFLKCYEWKNSYKAVVIGKTTAKHLPSYIKAVISENTSLEACVQKALEL